MSDIAVAAVLAGAVLLASMISVEAGLSVALIELFAGFVLGNALSLDVPSWLNFIGTFAGVVLTFWPARRSTSPNSAASGRHRCRSASFRSSARSSSSRC